MKYGIVTFIGKDGKDKESIRYVFSYKKMPDGKWGFSWTASSKSTKWFPSFADAAFAIADRNSARPFREFFVVDESFNLVNFNLVNMGSTELNWPLTELIDHGIII